MKDFSAKPPYVSHPSSSSPQQHRCYEDLPTSPSAAIQQKNGSATLATPQHPASGRSPSSSALRSNKASAPCAPSRVIHQSHPPTSVSSHPSDSETTGLLPANREYTPTPHLPSPPTAPYAGCQSQAPSNPREAADTP